MAEKVNIMTTRNIRTALLTSAACIAFDNGPGWKKDESGALVMDNNGDPVWINNTGVEASVKGDAIANLNAEAKANRLRAEKAEGERDKYRSADGKLLDPDIAAKAVDTVSKLDAKKLIDAGEVETVREQMRAEFTTQLTEKDAKINELTTTNKTMLVDKAFDGSEFVRDRLAVPRDMFRDSFGKQVKAGDDGKLEFYGRDGNRLLSKKNAGDYATGDEAFELLVDMHPQKDTILKPDTGGGSGNNGGGGQRGTGKRMSRSEFNGLDPMKQAEIGSAVGKGEMTLYE